MQAGLYDPKFEHDSCGVGFVANTDGSKTNRIILQGLEVLDRLKHRGAAGADPETGDGSGILIQMPDKFLRLRAQSSRINLPPAGEYGCGLIFLPKDRKEREKCKKETEKIAKSEGLEVLGWRKVPVNPQVLGNVAKKSEPEMEHLFIGFGSEKTGVEALERKLYVVRRLAEKKMGSLKLSQKSFFYITHLSAKVLVYKGLPLPERLGDYFMDLKDPDMESAIALVHSRYSTNTFPSWNLAQPFRYLAHNGEINTLRGNINSMRAREAKLESKTLGQDLKKVLPTIVEGGSDSAMLDNVLELLVQSGRKIQHSMSMLIPESWNQLNPIRQNVREFYDFHAHFMEPWDGPSAVAFTNGDVIGAMLDRNGLRPARYIITKDNFCVMASEVGVLDIPSEKIASKGRLLPGKIFLIDTRDGSITYDDEIKNDLAGKNPYGEWNRKNNVLLDEVRKKVDVEKIGEDELFKLQKNFGYTREDLETILSPMAKEAREPVGSMGNDTPLAVFSRQKPILFNYFKQLFAQVTNPPIDSIRESLVMSLVSFIGSQKNLLTESPAHAQMIRLNHPILANKEIQILKKIEVEGFKSNVVDILFNPAKGEDGLKKSLKKINDACEKAIAGGVNIIILSDRGVDENNASIPSLLAVSSLHQHLVRKGLRSQASIVLESGEPREVMHFALLIGFGASAVNPYLALETLRSLHQNGVLGGGVSFDEVRKNYREALGKGILKIMSKMGISTIRSYCGSQIFEAIGLDKKFVDEYFSGTASRIGGVGLEKLAKDAFERHKKAFHPTAGEFKILDFGGQYRCRKDGEKHRWDSDAITSLQEAVRKNDYKIFKKFSSIINRQDKDLYTIRGLIDFKGGKPIPLGEVEPAGEIVKRFVSGAMSFGSISREAHETIAIALNRMGCRSNSGEGGEDPDRFRTLPNGDSRISMTKQVASGRFGVTTNYLVNCTELQIKMAQGAKPGEGGQLPGHKVNEEIARTRYSTPGVTLISPPPHHDIYSIEDLAQLIFDLKNVNPKARVSVKLVSEIGVGTVAAGVAKAKADMILISGHDGGTGASPLSSIKHAGLPWEIGLAETQQTLVMNNLRGLVRLQTDGQIRTGKDIAVAAMLGAEEFGFATSLLVVLGCVMMRKCHVNTCPVGIATQDPVLRKRFCGKPEYLINFFHFMAEELREIMAGLGFKTVDEMVGRTDMLDFKDALESWRGLGVDLSKILYKPETSQDTPTRHDQKSRHPVGRVLDEKLSKLVLAAAKAGEPVELDLTISNTDRTVGGMLSGAITKEYGEQGLSDGFVKINFTGSAGQCFGAFLVNGVEFTLNGDANDYVGKGMSGGRIIVKIPQASTFPSNKNIIAGNVLLYGATGGEAYINGVVGERFAIRNSGASAVVEGVGDHGCEYMTGGRIVVLGRCGRNFAAGMSGGIAYVYDEVGNFNYFCNTEMVGIEELDGRDLEVVHEMIWSHVQHTESKRGRRILDDFEAESRKFVKVMPNEYRRVLEARGELLQEKKRGDYDGTS